ncbi:TPA: SufD family Fe-S cluster assembly protein, partial [Methanosarcinaceae archaeon]|nr:SufD family Fe-S cluster assembly protein [Methanosarcinaceae archaeon]
MTLTKLDMLSKDTEDMNAAYAAAGGNSEVLHNHEMSSLVVSGNKVLSANGT